MFSIISLFFKVLSIIIPILIAVAYFTIAERKLMGTIQRRKGPNVVGFFGLFQPLSDGLKLFSKETILPTNANTNIFLFAPSLAFLLSLMGWAIIPFSEGSILCDLNLGVLYLLAISSINVYGVLLAGWSSNSKYAYLGALRSAAQMISYEISIGFTVLNVVVCASSFNLTVIVMSQKSVWFVFPLFPIFVIFYISMLAETNRHPFDLPEAEAELVSGYNVEYSAMTFALFFLAEYSNMLLMSAFASILFLGGWLPVFNTSVLFFEIPQVFWFSLKILIGVIFFITTRATLPRYRYDQLMYLGWKCFFPFTLAYFILVVGIIDSVL